MLCAQLHRHGYRSTPAQVSQTLVSTGTRAIYLAPVDALHGDIGIVQPNDYLVMLSKSGAGCSASGGGDTSPATRGHDPLGDRDSARRQVARGGSASEHQLAPLASRHAGDTQELMMLAPYAKAKGAKLISISAKSDSE